MSGAASLFSAIDSAKRKVSDALANPMAAFSQFVDNKNEEAGHGLSLLKESTGPGEKATPKGVSARAKLIEHLAEGYNPAGILAGPMARTADFGALKKAVQMELKKAPPEEIWHEAGWGRGLDRRWRFEIPDQGAGPQPSAMRSAGPSGQASNDPALWLAEFDKSYRHPELFEAYPQLKDIRGKLGVDPTMQARYSGQYMPGTGGAPGQLLAVGKDGRYLNETVLHELQHGVQSLEKFAGGGNPQQFAGMTNTPEEAWKLYARLKGEAEARLIEGRSRMAPQDLRNVYPWGANHFQGITGVYPGETFTSMPGPMSRR